MSAQTNSSINRRLLIISLVVTAGFIAILLLVDQSIAIALIIGITIAWGLRLTSRLARRNIRLAVFILVVVIAVLGITITMLSMLGPKIGTVFSEIVSGLDGGGPAVPPACDDIQIMAVDLPGGEFEAVREQTTITQYGKNSGLILKELAFYPAQHLQCQVDSDNPMTVELTDLPRNVFFQARGATKLSRETYLNTETIRWKQTETQIRFSYLPRGLRFLRQPLAFFYGIGSIGEGIMGVLGFVGTFAVSAIIQPKFEDMARERLKKWFLARRKSKDKAKDARTTTAADAEPNEDAQ